MRFLPLVLILAACSDANRQSTALPVETCSITPSAAWANAVALPDDAFVHRASASAPATPGVGGWVKFAVLECLPGVVFFQDSSAYPFHYDFAVNELDPFVGMSRAEFDAATLYDAGRRAILGAVLVEPNASGLSNSNEYGIQLVANDAIARERVVEVFELVRANIGASAAANVFYFPTFEQKPTAVENEAYFASVGVTISSVARWSKGDVVYAPGWAIGELAFFAADEIDDAYERGDLEPDDILLTDGVPASVPLVAAILTLSPSSPSAHTAILSRTFGVPFGFLADEARAEHARALVGRRVAVRAYVSFGETRIDVIDVEDEVDDALLTELRMLQAPDPLELTPVTPAGQIAFAMSDVELADVGVVGGKSAGFGTLARALPANVPTAVAFSFDLWKGMLDRPGTGGVGASTLRERIDMRLVGHAYPPADMAQLAADLKAVRDWIKDPALAPFAPGHEAEVLAVLLDPTHAFASDAKIRFRSSSNMEDAARFTGAGLYSSNSGCLLDDLDEDEDGPSHCDPSEENERGVLRAMRKVFASFYDEQPFLSRLRYGVDERDVGMAILAHHSFPDEFELANGVATYERTAARNYTVTLETQAGAASVTNPEPGEIPERVTATRRTFGSLSLEFEGPSNLVPLGATVMDWSGEYEELVGLLKRAADRFASEAGRSAFTLEFEFKKLAAGGAALPAGGLVVKQLRELPTEDTTRDIVPFVIASTASRTTYQGGLKNLLSNHRLKVDVDLAVRSGWLDAIAAAENLFERVDLRFTDGCSVQERSFDVATSSDAFQAWDAGAVELTLAQPSLANPRTLVIRTLAVPERVSRSESPILFAHDFVANSLTATHSDPVPLWQGLPFTGIPATFEEDVVLVEPAVPSRTDLERVVRGSSDGIDIEVRFASPEPPSVSAGYTAPVSRWDRTIVTGLTADPIVLTSAFSQSARPGHHNATENFLFEPRLDPGVSPELLAELEYLGVDVIVLALSRERMSDEAEIATFAAAELRFECVTAE